MISDRTPNNSGANMLKTSFGTISDQSGADHAIDQMERGDSFSIQEMDAKGIIHPLTTNKKQLDTYRELRTKLLKKSSGQNFVCMVSSISRGGGASIVALNLASAIALDKTKTAIIVDCDLYSPSIENTLELSLSEGITDYLGNQAVDIESILHPTGIERLRAISVGGLQESGAEFFSTERMGQFIGALKNRYPDRYIIIDAPPVGITSEARILSELCDFSVLVVPYGKATTGQIEASVDAVGANKLAGIVFNQ